MMNIKHMLSRIVSKFFSPNLGKEEHKTLQIVPKHVVIQPVQSKSGHNSKGAKKSRKKKGY